MTRQPTALDFDAIAADWSWLGGSGGGLANVCNDVTPSQIEWNIFISKDLRIFRLTDLVFVYLVILYGFQTQSKSPLFTIIWILLFFLPTTLKQIWAWKKITFTFDTAIVNWLQSLQAATHKTDDTRKQAAPMIDSNGWHRAARRSGWIFWMEMGGMELTDLTDSEWSWCRIKVFPPTI